MTKFRVHSIAGCLILLISGAHVHSAAPADSDRPLDFEKVFSIIQSNLAGMTSAELESAAVAGLIRQLEPRVLLEQKDETPEKASTNHIKKASVLEERFGYLQISQVEAGFAVSLRDAIDRLKNEKKGKLNGLVLDLRFANGHSYAAASEAANLFLSEERPLLSWDNVARNSTAKTNAITLPLALLVNADTEGASEALAAALRQADSGLIIGNRTAGRALGYKEFVLENGQRLKIASGQIRAGDKLLSTNGISPDIQVNVAKEDERAYLEDPYRILVNRGDGSTNGIAAAGVGRPPRRRFNESDLLRMQQEGLERLQSSELEENETPPKPVVNDPVLARGLDFLKGLALVENRR